MVNVFDFGAVGDGQVDDTAALQHALEAGDGVLRLNKGTYRITRPLHLDLTKQGYGAVSGEAGTSRLVMAGKGPAIRITGNHTGTALPGTVQPHTWDQERFPIVEGIEILGEHPEAVGIELKQTMQAVVTKVLIRGCRHGVHLIERNRNFILSDSHLYDNQEYGLFLDRCNLHQINVHGNHISYNRKAGIKTLDGDIHNFQITGNDIEYNNNPGIDSSPQGEPTGAEIWCEATNGTISEVTIASNTIQATIQPGGANIRVWGSRDEFRHSARLISVTGNVLGAQTRGIEIRNTQRMTVTGNTIYDSADLSIFASECSGIDVGHNTFIWRVRQENPPRDGIHFENCDNCALVGLVTERLSSGTAEKGAGITLVNSTDMAVSNCLIIDPLVRGIELENCRRCRISDNSIVDRRSQPSMLEAIRIHGESRDNLVQNNLLGGTKNKLIDASPDSTAIHNNFEVSSTTE